MELHLYDSVIFAAATMQFILATGFNITCLLQLIKGFITEGNTPDGPLLYFRNAGSLEHVIQEGLYFTNVRHASTVSYSLTIPQSIIGDGILVCEITLAHALSY